MAKVTLLQKAIVVGLARGCEVIDRLPFDIGVRTRLGCPSDMALWSSQLDERWEVGWWQPSE